MDWADEASGAVKRRLEAAGLTVYDYPVLGRRDSFRQLTVEHHGTELAAVFFEKWCILVKSDTFKSVDSYGCTAKNRRPPVKRFASLLAKRLLECWLVRFTNTDVRNIHEQ